MKYLWSWLERRSWKAATKYRALLWLMSLLSGLAGALLWAVVQLWTLKTVDWLLCFVGYPVVASWLGVVLYGYRHEFCNGAGNPRNADTTGM